MSNYPIAVNLAAYNGARWLPYCLESLVRQTNQQFYLVIIDDASLDNSCQVVEEFLAVHTELASRTRLMRNRQNMGFARTHNQALSWSSGEYVLLVNQDIILAEDYIKKTVKVLLDHHEVAAVTGKLKRWHFDAENYYSGRELEGPQIIDSAGFKILRNRSVSERGAGEVDRGQYNKAEEIFGVSGALPMYRRHAIKEVSPNGEMFDSDFVMYKEDVDLAWRLQRAGFKAFYIHEAVAYHDRSLKGASTKYELIKRHLRRSARLSVYSWVNHLAVLIKNDSWYNIVRDLPWILGYELQKLGYLLLFKPGQFRSAIKRLFAIRPAMFRKRRELKSINKIRPADLRHFWI